MAKTGLSFYGSNCTKDCSGHLAGYMWRQSHPNATVKANRSFTNGAKVNDLQTATNRVPIGVMARNNSTGKFQKIKRK